MSKDDPEPPEVEEVEEDGSPRKPFRRMQSLEVPAPMKRPK
jgi:hypothetical protein